MAHPPVVHSTVAKLVRADIAGVNVHTLPIALDRSERENIDFASLTERQVAIVLLERAGFPESMSELSLFLNVNATLTPTALTAEITDRHAPAYVTWLAGFLRSEE